MRLLNFSIGFMKTFIIIYVLMFVTSCAVLDEWLGWTKDEVFEIVDTNKDGKISPEEAKNSKFDLNKDGKIDEKEYEKAAEGNDAPSELFSFLALMNVPLAGVAAVGLSKFKKYKQHAKALIGGIEDLKNLGKDGYTIDDIYDAQKISARYRSDAVALGKFVKEVKGEMRIKNQHLAPGIK